MNKPRLCILRAVQTFENTREIWKTLARKTSFIPLAFPLVSHVLHTGIYIARDLNHGGHGGHPTGGKGRKGKGVLPKDVGVGVQPKPTSDKKAPKSDFAYL